jgi:FkbM family methyltransferase
MNIQSSREEKKLESRLRWIRRIAGLSRHIRKRRISRFCNRAFYLGRDPASSLKLIAPYHRGLLIHIDTNSWLERWILNQDYYEPELVDFLERCLKPGMVALDVGANIGCHTLVMANAVGATGRVFAFEPNPAIHRRLRQNIALNRFAQVEVLPVCLGDHAGDETLFAPLEGEYNQGLASMHRGNLGPRCQEIAVTSVTLDDFVREQGLNRLDLLKVDVEGHEFQVLSGAGQVLRQFRPVLVLEFSERQWANAGVRPEQVEGYFAGLGYALYVLRAGYTTSIAHGLGEECNLVAVPVPEVTEPAPLERPSAQREATAV